MEKYYLLAMNPNTQKEGLMQFVKTVSIKNSTDSETLNEGLEISISRTNPMSNITVSELPTMLHFKDKSEAINLITLLQSKFKNGIFLVEAEISSSIKVC